ncbi:MAG: T9SS type A sorting domain-containing protein, partial [Candidatus Delongbacteria bacterium]|nr:T9SS type A sorting domain-containing protein [Candidatus Delongbacteria bacterium]
MYYGVIVMKKLIVLILFLMIIGVFPVVSPISSQTDTLFVDDFESGSSHWNLTGNWAIADEDSISPTHSLTESPGGDYLPDENATATLIDTLHLSVYYDANISFWIKYDIEYQFDYMHLEVTKDNGVTWSNLKTWTGEDVGWYQEYISLGLYTYESDVNLRFRWESDSAIEESGTYIDDILIIGIKNVPPDYPIITYEDPPEFYEGSFGEFTDVVNVYSAYTVTDVEVNCSVDGVPQTKVDATYIMGDDWEFIIPMQPPGSVVEYTFFARDSMLNETDHYETYKYISGDHRIYDSGIVSYYNTTENSDAKAVRISFPDADSLSTTYGRLYSVLIRNYRNIDHSSDDMTVRVWADNGGVPGVELITPFDVTPEATLISTMAFTAVDLRHLGGLLVNNNFWIGYSSEYGAVYGLQEATDETGETDHRRSYNGTWNGDGWDWEAAALETNYHIRAVIEYPIMGIEDYIMPTTTSLEQNYPNPFNPNTTIHFSVPDNNSQIKLVVYNVKGELISTLFDGIKNIGKHSAIFDASSLNSGVYYYSLEVNGVKES